MMTPQIKIDRNQLEKLCKEFGVRRLALFGSVIRDDFGDDSDVDILVEFEPKTKVRTFSFFSLQKKNCQTSWGEQEDLSTPGFLSPRIRDKISEEARLVYEAA